MYSVLGLGNSDFQTRENSEYVLRKCRPFSDFALKDGINHKNPEVVFRSHRVLTGGLTCSYLDVIAYFKIKKLIDTDYPDVPVTFTTDDGEETEEIIGELPYIPIEAYANLVGINYDPRYKYVIIYLFESNFSSDNKLYTTGFDRYAIEEKILIGLDEIRFKVRGLNPIQYHQRDVIKAECDKWKTIKGKRKK